MAPEIKVNRAPTLAGDALNELKFVALMIIINRPLEEHHEQT
jgi:hypothetical protein